MPAHRKKGHLALLAVLLGGLPACAPALGGEDAGDLSETGPRDDGGGETDAKPLTPDAGPFCEQDAGPGVTVVACDDFESALTPWFSPPLNFDVPGSIVALSTAVASSGTHALHVTVPAVAANPSAPSSFNVSESVSFSFVSQSRVRLEFDLYWIPPGSWSTGSPANAAIAEIFFQTQSGSAAETFLQLDAAHTLLTFENSISSLHNLHYLETSRPLPSASGWTHMLMEFSPAAPLEQTSARLRMETSAGPVFDVTHSPLQETLSGFGTLATCRATLGVQAFDLRTSYTPAFDLYFDNVRLSTY